MSADDVRLAAEDHHDDELLPDVLVVVPGDEDSAGDLLAVMVLMEPIDSEWSVFLWCGVATLEGCDDLYPIRRH